MKAQDNFTDLRYDFSVLSKNRLRTYNLLLQELEEHDEDVRVLGEDDLEFLSAAGIMTHNSDELPLQ